MNIKFQLEVVELAKLVPDAQNCRLHSVENIDYLKNSLKVFGFQKPIVVNKKYEIAAGNGTYLAAKELGCTQVPVAVSDLSAQELRAFALADNQIATTSSWDLTKLSEQIQSLAVWDKDTNWKALGFNENELKLMLSYDEKFSPEVNESDFKESKTGSVGESVAEKKKYKPLKVNDDQRLVIEQALQKVRERENDKSMPDGQALEFVCAEYLASV